MRKILIALALLLFAPMSAEAATCFWVGGSGNWDNSNTASWSSTTGGTASTCLAAGGIPKNSVDVANFDSNSGGGTVTVCGASSANCPTSAGTLTLSQVTAGAFTGTLDFATNNPSVNASFVSFSGTGVRTINMGSGTWTLSGTATSGAFDNATTTNETFNAGTSTVHITGTTGFSFIRLGGKPLNIVTVDALGYPFYVNDAAGVSNTIATLNLTAPLVFGVTFGTTLTITTPVNWSGSSSSNFAIVEHQNSTNTTKPALNLAAGSAISWAAIGPVNFTGSAVTATNSFNVGGSAGAITITPPSGGGGTSGYIIGGQ